MATAKEITAETKDRMKKAVSHLREEFGGIRTGRASSAQVEKIMVDYYGAQTPLQQLAGFSVPEPRVLVVQPYDKGAMKAIEKAIQSSDLGVNPSNDGANIRITFPELTTDRRKELVKVVKSRAEDAKVTARNVRRAARDSLDKLEKDGQISRDELERAEKDLDKLTQEAVAEIDSHLGQKEKELLEV